MQLKGIIGIQRGIDTNELMFMLTSFNLIDDGDINTAHKAYMNGDNKSFDKLFSNESFLSSIESKEIIGTDLLKIMLLIKRSLEYAQLTYFYGLLILEDLLDDESVERQDIFDFGICLSLDTDKREAIDNVLENIILSRDDYLHQKYFYQAQKAAALSICYGDNKRLLFEIVLSFFDEDIQKVAREVFEDYFKQSLGEKGL
jgi:hypothetical protein